LLVGALLDLVSFLIVLLLSKVGLDLAQVEELGREFEDQRKGLLHGVAVLTKLLGVFILKLLYLLLVLLLSLLELKVVVLVELLVLLDVRLLDLLLPLLVGEDELLVLHVEFLFLEFGDAVLGQLSLHVATLFFAGNSVLLHRRSTQIKGMGESSRIRKAEKCLAPPRNALQNAQKSYKEVSDNSLYWDPL